MTDSTDALADEDSDPDRSEGGQGRSNPGRRRPRAPRDLRFLIEFDPLPAVVATLNSIEHFLNLVPVSK